MGSRRAPFGMFLGGTRGRRPRVPVSSSWSGGSFPLFFDRLLTDRR